MGTRWRGMLAPVNAPTGDGRRIRTFTHRDLPVALKWQRTEEPGHIKSVVVGSTERIEYITTAEALAAGWVTEEMAQRAGLSPDTVGVWAAGEFFDDIDPAEMPRLAEDVAEAKLLVTKGVLGPSVDAGEVAFYGFVHPGTDDVVTADEVFEAEDAGEQLDIEALIDSYEIAAATLVPIPAFAETPRPFELLPAAEGASEENAVTAAARRVALVAAAPAISADWFDDPHFTEVTPLTVASNGRVWGHIAAFGVCHVGIPGMCTTAPHSASDYANFHRYAATTGGVDLPVAAGRITAGHGAMTNVCACCPGNDDHACSRLSFGGAVAHHDPMRVLAYVRAGEDEHGIWVAGIAAPEADDRDRAALARQRFSGDWRDVGGNLELTEVLALSRERPGFPLPRTSVANGRQRALVAAGAVRPTVGEAPGTVTVNVVADPEALRQVVLAELRAHGVVPPAPTTVTAADGEHTGAMVALVPSEQDVARLAVDGGLPPEELHLTLMYLGDAAAIDDPTRQAIVNGMTALVGDLQEQANAWQVLGDGFAISVFNPGDASDRETAIVLGVSGADLDTVHGAIVDAMGQVFAAPDQHAPWVPHVTLAYSDDLSLVQEYADRVGPVTFDRLRVAFAGDNIDIPPGGQPSANTTDSGDDGLSLADRGTQLAADLRAMDAAELTTDLDTELRARDAADLLADLASIS